MENLRICLSNIADQFIESEKINSNVMEYLKEFEKAEDFSKWYNNMKDIMYQSWFFGVVPEDIAGQLNLQFRKKREDGMKATFYMRLSNSKIGWISITNSNGKTLRWNPFSMSLSENVISYIEEYKGFKVANFDGFVTYEASKKGRYDGCDFEEFIKKQKKN